MNCPRAKKKERNTFIVWNAEIRPFIHNIVVVTSPIGVHDPPAFAAITTAAPKILPRRKTLIEIEKRASEKQMNGIKKNQYKQRDEEEWHHTFTLLPNNNARKSITYTPRTLNHKFEVDIHQS